MREVGQEGEEERDSSSKRVNLVGDVAGMSDAEWMEHKDEMWERRQILTIIQNLVERDNKEYANRACNIANIQHRSGAYYVLELGENFTAECKEDLEEIGAHGMGYPGYSVWTKFN